ncbi:microtubule-associated protein 9 isoform X5 [Heterocephalus glaber]|uniref:Microtubule-associated protein 9 isoform X5 n=1 Tax=Heterocephalus glaber TaxID=10181 RepID=A0AAX6S3N9_HETGA|nr:microtubule-associated protein 9 isoform X5 [Heterocephalus glaber]
MADEVFGTTLAYTKSPKVTKRTTFQDELIRVITARSARQRSSEYSDDFESDVVSLGDFSDTSVDENLVKKKMNDFHISDDEEENSPRPSFLKRKKSNSDITRDEPEVAVKNSEEQIPDVCEDMVANSFSESHNKDQEVENERIKIKPKPRILPIKSTSSDQNGEFAENHNSLKLNENAENGVLIDRVAPELEKPTESELAAADLEEDRRKGEPSPEEDLAAAPLPSKSQRASVPASAAAPAQRTIEDRNMKSKKSTTDNRASSASARLMTSEFVRKSSSAGRAPWSSTSSHYLGTLKVLDQKPSPKPNLEPDTADHIRAAVYQEWLEKKNVHLHKKNRIKRIESENLRIQNEQKKAAKREEAIASFEAWKAMKEKEAKRLAAQKRLEEKNKRKAEEEEEAARKEEALQAFEKWKEKKMEYLKEKNKKEKEYERAKKHKEEETVAEKKKENLTAVEKWNEKKEALFKQKGKEKINERRMEELKRAEKNDKDKQAIDQYDKWLEKKERQERIQRKQKKRHSFLESEDLPPWSPPSRTVVSKVF